MQSFSHLQLKLVMAESARCELPYISAVHHEYKILKVSHIGATQSSAGHRNHCPADTGVPGTSWIRSCPHKKPIIYTAVEKLRKLDTNSDIQQAVK